MGEECTPDMFITTNGTTTRMDLGSREGTLVFTNVVMK
jgi:hypothetical protein